MRVAHLITRMIVGGAQENTLWNCRDLLEIYGDEVLLITGHSPGPEGDLLQRVDPGEVPVRLVDALVRPIAPRRDAAALSQLKRVIDKFQPDVVHTHSAKAGMLGRLAAWSKHVPAVVHTVHGAPFHPYQNVLARRFFQACERYAAHRCHRLISVADAMTDLMVQARIAPREKFITIYSGMDVEPLLRADEHRAEVRREFGFQEQHVVIGKIARLFHLKGHEYVLQAAVELVRKCPDVRFLWVGDGILREKWEAEATRLGLREHLRFAGLVDPQRIPALLGAMDILVHASLREGLARALPQALIAGKPVVSFDIDGAREVVINGVTGFLAPPQDAAALGKALLQLAADPALRARCGAAGRQRFTDIFRHQTMTRHIRELYETLLGRSAARR